MVLSWVPDTDNHKITKTYTRGENINEDITVYQNKTGDTANTNVTIDWSGIKTSVLPQTGESIKILAIIICIGIAIAFVKKIKNNLNDEEIGRFLEINKDYFENKGYKVYFTNAEFEYQNAKRKVEINEYMIAFKE